MTTYNFKSNPAKEGGLPELHPRHREPIAFSLLSNFILEKKQENLFLYNHMISPL
jgi:hypothetical protein